MPKAETDTRVIAARGRAQKNEAMQSDGLG
jgi:hypothetical protein